LEGHLHPPTFAFAYAVFSSEFSFHSKTLNKVYHTSGYSWTCPLFQAFELCPVGLFNFPKNVRFFYHCR